MYAKLSIRNAKRAAKDYVIYFVTLTLCVSLFYGFTSLSSESNKIVTGEQYDFVMIYDLLKYATYFITGVLIILVAYVNKYIMKRRKREFATYILLGTEQRYVAVMFFIETLIMGIGAIILGIFIGSLISQGLTAIVLMTSEQEIIFKFRFYADTIRNTFIFFIGMFCIIGVFNVRSLNKTKLIDMFNDNRKVEKAFKGGELIYGILGSLSAISYIYAAVGLNKFSKIYRLAGIENSEKQFWVFTSLIAIIIGTYTLFYFISYIIIFIKKKCVNVKYKYTNLFFLGNLLGRIKTNPILLATITLTLLGAMVCFTMTVVMSEWAEGYLNYRMAYDVNVDSKSFSKNPSESQFDGIIEYMKNSEFGLEDYCILETYHLNEENSLDKNERSTNMSAVGLSDYNKLREMAGYDKVSLKENEFTMQWYRMVLEEDIEKYIYENQTIEINGETYNISPQSGYRDSIGESPYAGWSDALIVVNDNVINELILNEVKFYANSKDKMSYEFSIEILDFIDQWVIEKYGEEAERGLYSRAKIREYNQILGITIAMKTLGIYGGTILLMICLTILSLQQLSDSLEHKHRFDVLRKLGVDNREINRLVLKQIGVYFGVPIIVATIGFTLVVKYFASMCAVQVHAFIGNDTFKVCIGISFIMMVIMYVSYFCATCYTFKRNIK